MREIDDMDALAMDLCRLSGCKWRQGSARLWRKRAAALLVLADKRIPQDEATEQVQRIMRGGR